MQEKIAISWSGGKDACLTLHQIKKSEKYVIDHLHTIIGEDTDRVSMHGIPRSFIEAQAEALNIPLKISYLPSDTQNNSYERLMSEYTEWCKSNHIHTIAFGDIFLEDLRKYREDKLSKAGINCLFPIWGKPTSDIMKYFLSLGFKTKICAGDASKISRNMIGTTITPGFLNTLNQEVDPCGENGEFHTFVYDGPLFKNPIQLNLKSIESHFYEYHVEQNAQIKKVKSEFYFADFEKSEHR